MNNARRPIYKCLIGARRARLAPILHLLCDECGDRNFHTLGAVRSFQERSKAPKTAWFLRIFCQDRCSCPLGDGVAGGEPQPNVQSAAESGGLPKDLVLHLARHECGTKVCRAKGIEYARRLLGHSNIATTQRYMHLDDKELAEAQDLM